MFLSFCVFCFFFFFFNDTATTEIYTLSLHDALPIYSACENQTCSRIRRCFRQPNRSEEHTSELQSPDHLVCRLLLEKKKQISRRKRTPSSTACFSFRSPAHPPR